MRRYGEPEGNSGQVERESLCCWSFFPFMRSIRSCHLTPCLCAYTAQQPWEAGGKGTSQRRALWIFRRARTYFIYNISFPPPPTPAPPLFFPPSPRLRLASPRCVWIIFTLLPDPSIFWPICRQANQIKNINVLDVTRNGIDFFSGFACICIDNLQR